MCEYCEKKEFWRQPGFKGRVKIYNFETKQPEMVILSEQGVGTLWGGRTTSLCIPIKFCPFCGEKLGKQTTEINN